MVGPSFMDGYLPEEVIISIVHRVKVKRGEKLGWGSVLALAQGLRARPLLSLERWIPMLLGSCLLMPGRPWVHCSITSQRVLP